MSKLSDYSKFDHLNDNDSDAEEEEDRQHVSMLSQQHQQLQQAHRPTASPQSSSPTSQTTTGKSQSQSTNPSTVSSPPSATTTSSNATITAVPTVGGPSLRKDESTGRFVFEYNGQPIYSWEQTIDDVTIYVQPPPFILEARQIKCQISANRLKLGLHDSSNEWFLNEDTFGTVDVSESTWSLEDDDTATATAGSTSMLKDLPPPPKKVITIYLTKAQRALVWESALKGNPQAASLLTGTSAATTATATATATGAAPVRLDPMAIEQEKKKLLLERFQEEHRGMDFRDADFNGSVPDARTFMGGVSYS
jgi:hypothetical protein